MKLNELFFGKKPIPHNKTQFQAPKQKDYELITDETTTFNSNGSVTVSDIVRSAIKPKVKAIGKLSVKHLLNDIPKLNSEVVLLLQEPNPIDTLQTLLEKLATQLQLNNNAYALVEKDKDGYPIEIYPIFASNASMVKSDSGNLFVEFSLTKGGRLTAPYEDVIHLRQDYNSKEYFGEHPSVFLGDLLQSIGVADESVEKAIRNSTTLKWLMKFNTNLKEEDIKKQTDNFKKTYMSMENNGGVGGIDNKVDLEQIKSNVFVPDTSIQKEKIERIYDYFGVNEDIIQSRFDEDTWNSYYESEIEPILIQLSNEFTRKIFLKSERLSGNKVVFESAGLQFASMESKIKLVDLVDRGLMTPNESRKILNLPPLEGGDVPIRRLDTARVDDERFQDGYNEANTEDTLKGGEDDGNGNT